MLKFISVIFLTLITAIYLTPTPVNAQYGESRYTDRELLKKPSNFFDQVNPIAGKFDNTSNIINALLPSVLTIAGLILLFMLISGGFTIMTATADPQKAELGKKRITTAIMGFVLLFSAYWIAQLLEIIFGITILGS